MEEAKQAAEVVVLPTKTDAIVDQWVRECLHNSAASRDTQVMNVITGAAAELKRRLNGA